MQEIIALVTDRNSCQRLVLAGAEIARREKKELCVVSVQPKSDMGNGEALEELYSLSRSVRARMTVYYHDDTEAAAVNAIRRSQPYCLVAGDSFLSAIRGSCREVPVHLVTESEMPIY